MSDARKIIKEVAMPNSEKLVLYDQKSYDGFRSPENLVLLNAVGSVIWKAKPYEDSADCFVDVRLDGDTITANTFSCWLVTLDRATGRILTAQFTK